MNSRSTGLPIRSMRDTVAIKNISKGAMDAYRGALAPSERPMWPEAYLGDDPESAFRFVTECWWTDNEADRKIELIPKQEFVYDFCSEWVNAYRLRQPMICEKSRRIMISWICRGLETWVMGKQRGSWIIIDQTHKNAAEHLWRIDFSLNQLKNRKPEMGIEFETRGSVLIKEPTNIILGNGSMITQGHQDAGSAQGKGKTGVTLEEVSKYASPSEFWGQALIVTQGSGEGSGGWVCGIANASPNADWLKIKHTMRARTFLGIDDKDWI